MTKQVKCDGCGTVREAPRMDMQAVTIHYGALISDESHVCSDKCAFQVLGQAGEKLAKTIREAAQ